MESVPCSVGAHFLGYMWAERIWGNPTQSHHILSVWLKFRADVSIRRPAISPWHLSSICKSDVCSSWLYFQLMGRKVEILCIKGFPAPRCFPFRCLRIQETFISVALSMSMSCLGHPFQFCADDNHYRCSKCSAWNMHSILDYMFNSSFCRRLQSYKTSSSLCVTCADLSPQKPYHFQPRTLFTTTAAIKEIALARFP